MQGTEPAGATGTPQDFERLLVFLRDARGFDFTGYKRASLERRVQRRMSDVGIGGYAEYQDLLEVDADEFAQLFTTILINVTSFFRDPEAWERLATDWLPGLLAERPTGPIRAWSAGCASGQEAYTVAMVLAEALGPEQFRDRVKIYATDVDEEALQQARSATYSQREVEGVPPDLLGRYFEQRGQRWTFRPDLRRSVVFGRADVVQDAPISHLDLLVCRNTLMYMTAETQARIAERLHYSLNPSGVLLLGKAEMLLSHGALFAPLDLPSRLFTRVGPARTPARALGHPGEVVPAVVDDDPARLRLEALGSSPAAMLLLDAHARVSVSNQRAEALFGLGAADVGKPFQDLEVSYRPVDLRSALDGAHAQKRPVTLHGVRLERQRAEPQWVDVVVVPLRTREGAVLGTAVHFVDVTRPRQLQEELEGAHRQLEAAYEELQSTVEELETTNEELQSTVEELETTNEELHSTNEELETMNEELQSMNDELQTSNDRLRLSTEEVSSLNAYMEGVFSSLRVGVVVVDAALRVTVWNEWATELWGVRGDEAAGEHVLGLDVGLPLLEVAPVLRSVLAGDGEGEVLVDAVDRRGRPARMRLVVTPLRGAGSRTPRGAVVIMERRDDAEPGA